MVMFKRAEPSARPARSTVRARLAKVAAQVRADAVQAPELVLKASEVPAGGE